MAAVITPGSVAKAAALVAGAAVCCAVVYRNRQRVLRWLYGKFDVILWDMDGVLVDVSGSYRRAIEATAEEFIGHPVPPGTVQRFKDMGGYNNDWKLTAAVIKEAGVDAPYDAIVDAFQGRYRGSNFDGLIATEPALINGTAIFSRMRDAGVVMGLVTGRPDAEARWTLRRFGWDAFMRVVVAMEAQEGRGKPDPFPLTKALEQIAPRANLKRVAYVGDTGDDMKAARAAGMFAIGVVPPYLNFQDHSAVLVEAGADVVLPSPNLVPALLWGS